MIRGAEPGLEIKPSLSSVVQPTATKNMDDTYSSGKGRGDRGLGCGVLGSVAPVPGQQLVQTGCRMVIDPTQHVSQPGARVGVVQLGGDDERIHGRSPFAAAVRAVEQLGPVPENHARTSLS